MGRSVDKHKDIQTEILVFLFVEPREVEETNSDKAWFPSLFEINIKNMNTNKIVIFQI